jgi:hypothetical protein
MVPLVVEPERGGKVQPVQLVLGGTKPPVPSTVFADEVRRQYFGRKSAPHHISPHLSVIALGLRELKVNAVLAVGFGTRTVSSNYH